MGLPKGEKHSQGIPSLGHAKYGHGGRERGHLGVSVGSPKGEKHSQGNLSLPVVPSMHMEVGAEHGAHIIDLACQSVLSMDGGREKEHSSSHKRPISAHH